MATNQTRNWLGALVQRGVRLALVVPVLLSVSVANAWAVNWINPSVTISHVADGRCVAGPFANDTFTSVSVDWTAFNSDASPGRNIFLVSWRESSSGGATTEFFGGAPVGQLPTQTTADTVQSSYLIGNLMYFGLSDVWDSGSVWSTSRSPALSPDLTAPATGVSGYTAIDMTTDPDCVAIPEINVTGNSRDITDGDTSASTLDHSFFGTVAHASGTLSRTFTIENTGTGTLTLGANAATLSGTHAADFTVTSQPATTVAISGSTDVTVEFDPSALGTRSATLSIANDDADENPYTFAISGTGSGLPEINVTGNGQNIADGDTTPQAADHTDFGSIDINDGNIERIFTIENIGDETLSLGSNSVSLSGPDAAEFSIFSQPFSSVSSGSSRTFRVRFDPTTAGAKSATLTIANDDADESPYNFSVSGTAAVAPEIEVRLDNGILVPNGSSHVAYRVDSLSFNEAFGERTYTINNVGSDTLAISNVTITGTHAAEFSVVTPPAATVVAGGNTTFTLRFTQTTSGVRNATINIINNDADEGAFSFDTTGFRFSGPDLDMSGQGLDIANGDTTPRLEDDTDFGSIDVTSGFVEKSFTGVNNGDSGIGISSISVTGAHASDFSVTTGTEVAPLTVRFDPSAAGLRTATVNIASDALVDNPFTFAIQGTGTVAAPEIAVSSSESGAVADGGTDAQGSEAAAAAKTVTYTVSNTGTDDLTMATATSSTVTNVTVNSISVPVATTVTPGNSTTFTVQYTPTIAGAFSFDLAFTNNDGDENPYNMTISGTATGAPEMNVLAGITTPIADNPSHDPASVTGTRLDSTVGGSSSNLFTIENTGTGPLTLGANAVSLSGVGAGDFSVSLQPATSVAPGSTTSFRILFSPTIAGLQGPIDVAINSDDADENPYNFRVQGLGREIEIDVTGNGQTIADNPAHTPNTADHTDFGSIDIAAGAVTRTFTVENNGVGFFLTLDPNAVSLSGAHAGDFSVTAQPATSVDVGLTTTFQIAFDPSVAGVRGPVDVSIANSDPDEGPYNFRIQGTGTAVPEIDVSSSESGAVADGGTDAQGSEAAAAAKTVTYTVSNSGTDDLTLATATSSSLSNVSVNSISAPGSTTVTPGNSTTFTVQYTPTLAGAFSFDLAFTNNDGDENPYNMTVSGTGTGTPEIAVSSSESGSVADGGTDAQGSEVAAASKAITYTVSNTGTDDLTLATATSSGLSNVSVNSISAPGSTTVTPANSTTFTVQYTPTLAGAFSFDLAFTNNDGDENPYNATVSGTATGAPEIAVSSSESGALADGGTDAQGSESAGTAKTVTYTVSNTGTDDLTLTTATSSSLSNVTVNSISAPVATTVTPGNSTTFTVQYTPTLAGPFSFDLAFTNNDGDENPHNMTVSGTATGAPEVAVSSAESGAVADGGTDAQGNEAAGTAKTVTYTVSNTGTDDLTLATATSSSLSNVAINSTSAPVATTVTPGNSTTFTVQYTPTLAGAFSFDLAFTNNDGDESPYNMTVSGTATGAPEIAVSSSESGAVADGGTDAQGSEAAGASKTVTYTVSNTGTDDLTLATATSNALSNVTVNSISAPVATTVTPGNSTTFTVQYTPTLAGAFSFDLAFTNNDGNENPHNMTVSGTATGAPEISVSSSESGVVADGGTDAQGSEAAAAAKTVTYTVSNTGTDDLTLATATSSSLTNVTVNSISAPALTTVTPGNSSSFTVQYTPTLAGAFSFGLAFTNNDGDENPYNMTVSGTATGSPEIAVSSSESGAVADGGTDAQGNEAAGTAKTVTYTVSNTGTDDLTLAPATSSSLSNVTVNSISAPMATTVTPGSSTTYTVQYTPTLAGAFSFGLAFTNNDGDENPYNMTVSGTGAGSPEIAVSSSESGAVADNGTDAQDNEAAGSAKTVTYTVFNTGTDDLTLATATSSSLSNVTVNSISAPMATTVTPGSSTTYTVQYTPTLAGAFSFGLAFTNNDGDENPYNMTVSGTATGSPEIAVSSSESGAVADGGTDAQGNEAADSVKTVTYTVSNTGIGDLTLATATATSSSLSNVTVNSISAPASTTVTPGNSTTFTVQYTPTVAGSFTFNLAFINNDGDENPYNMTVSGAASGTPEINVTGNAVSIVDGDVTPVVADHTDFGSSDVTSGTVSRSFTIQNTGTDVLTLGANAASLSGANASDFTVSAHPSATVAPGGSTTLSVQFDPTAAGARNAVLTIANDDADENPYGFALAGEGISGGTITIVQNITGADVSVGFSSATPVLNFTLNSVSGTAQTSLVGVPAGSHSLIAEDLASIGYGVSSIACDDEDSTGDVVNRTATINLLSGEHVTCVFETIDTRGPTTQMIADFLGARNSLLLSNQPGSERRINRLKGGTGVSGGDSFQAFGHNLHSPLPVDVEIDDDSFSFATSLKRVMAAGGEVSLAANDNEGDDPLALDIWIEGSASRFIDGTSGGGSFGLLSFGVDYLVEPDLLIGFMGQIDRFKQDFTTPGSEIDGRGWLAGPYATLKLDEHLYLDVLGAWGRSDNDISPFGTYTDTFETDRWLVSSTLTGQFDAGNWDLRPSYTLQFLHERQIAYTDSLGVSIPEQSFSQGDMRLGPQIAYTHTFEDGSSIRPKGGFEGVYSFGERNTFSFGSFAAETQGLTGQVNGGLDYQTPGGLSLGLTTDFGGIGATAKSFGLTINLSMPLN